MTVTRIERLLDALDLDAKVAQLVGVRLPTDLVGDDGDDELLRRLCPHGIGAVSTLLEVADLDPGLVGGKVASLQRFLRREAPGGIPALVHAEALNGALHAAALAFPTPIGLASTFRPDLVEAMAEASSRQLAALGINHALSPVLDVARDPRYGRVHETYGEDPTCCAAFGAAFVRGMQASGTVLATGKHFLGAAAAEGGRHMGAVHVGRRELREVHGTPFEAAIRAAGLAVVMSSYSTVDGEAVSASRELLVDLLRDELGFDGLTVSDYLALTHLVTLHGVAGDLATAGRASVEAGLDIELPFPATRVDLAAAVREGALEEELLDAAVRRVLQAKDRVGLLVEAPVLVAPSFAPMDADVALARQLAADSLVLLHNDGVLPLAEDVSTIAVVGPFADRLRPLFAAYSSMGVLELVRYARDGTTMAGADVQGAFASRATRIDDAELEAAIAEALPSSLTISAALAARGTSEVEMATGCHHRNPTDADIEAAVELACRADVVVCAVGELTGWVGEATGGEGRDRSGLDLLGAQEALVRAVAATGTPVVVVLVCGRPLAVGWMRGVVGALLCAWHPGPFGGEVIADVLWGRANPGGRLPVTIPSSVGHSPTHLGSRAVSQVPYVDEPDDPGFPFGSGLSYTDFRVASPMLSSPTCPTSGSFSVTVDVTNTGARSGDEVIFCFGRDLVASVTRPAPQLLGFHRVSLDPGTSTSVVFEVPAELFAWWRGPGEWVIEPGEVEVAVGDHVVHLVLDGEEVVVAHRSVFVAEAISA